MLQAAVIRKYADVVYTIMRFASAAKAAAYGGVDGTPCVGNDGDADSDDSGSDDSGSDDSGDDDSSGGDYDSEDRGTDDSGSYDSDSDDSGDESSVEFLDVGPVLYFAADVGRLDIARLALTSVHAGRQQVSADPLR